MLSVIAELDEFECELSIASCAVCLSRGGQVRGWEAVVRLMNPGMQEEWRIARADNSFDAVGLSMVFDFVSAWRSAPIANSRSQAIMSATLFTVVNAIIIPRFHDWVFNIYPRTRDLNANPRLLKNNKLKGYQAGSTLAQHGMFCRKRR